MLKKCFLYTESKEIGFIDIYFVMKFSNSNHDPLAISINEETFLQYLFEIMKQTLIIIHNNKTYVHSAFL